MIFILLIIAVNVRISFYMYIDCHIQPDGMEATYGETGYMEQLSDPTSGLSIPDEPGICIKVVSALHVFAHYSVGLIPTASVARPSFRKIDKGPEGKGGFQA